MSFGGAFPGDEALTALIVSLQLEDLRDLAEKGKGKSKSPTDGEIAQETFVRELEALQISIEDHRYASALQRVAPIERTVLRDIQAEEALASSDRAAALHFQQTGSLPQTHHAGSPTNLSVAAQVNPNSG